MVVQYFDNGKRAEFNGIKFTRDDRTGYYLSTAKPVSNKRVRLHVYVYMTLVGDIPDGLQVHHVDTDKSNNEPENLQLIENGKHQRIHGAMLTENERSLRRTHMLENVSPKAKDWHKSAEGHAWHVAHGLMTSKLDRSVSLKCDQCGGEYIAKLFKSGNNFCSNKCKSAWRRESGIDNETRNCIYCGGEFVANKYTKTNRCKECARKGYRAPRKTGRLQLISG